MITTCGKCGFSYGMPTLTTVPAKCRRCFPANDRRRSEQPLASKTDDELRLSIHMKMLSKSKSASELGEMTVVPLGYAVDVAMQLIQARDEQRDIDIRIDELQRIINTAALPHRSFKVVVERSVELESKNKGKTEAELKFKKKES